MKKIMFNNIYGLTQAVLEGRKTQTRRVIPNSILEKCENLIVDYYNQTFDTISLEDMLLSAHNIYGCKPMTPYVVGEVVAVAQNYNSFYNYECDPRLFNGAGFTNKMFVKAELMPHHIRITNIRVERLQDISDEDCLAEGVKKVNFDVYVVDGIYVYDNGVEDGHYVFESAREAYSALIDKVSKKDVWKSNPYVFVYEFEKVD